MVCCFSPFVAVVHLVDNGGDNVDDDHGNCRSVPLSRRCCKASLICIKGQDKDDDDDDDDDDKEEDKDGQGGGGG